jgi:hypothetical protein
MVVLDGSTGIDLIERQRLETQQRLDSTKTRAERNKLGQFATPTVLATDILEYARTLMPVSQQIRFLDPAFGTGAFYSALLRSLPFSQVARAWGYEVDPHYGRESKKLWNRTPLELKIADFTQATPPTIDENRVNLLICNPPYVRHHHLSVDEKSRLRGLARQTTGIRLSGLAGLYCYFLLISHGWMADQGLAGWLIPSEFMDVNYGKQIKQYLLQRVTLLRIHRFDPDDVQFGDALVSSAIVWFKKEKPPVNHEVEFSYGGALTSPEVFSRVSMSVLRQTAKWSRFPKTPGSPALFNPKISLVELKLSDLFNIKRGIVTGANKFFILEPDQISKHKIPGEFLVPILPSPRYLVTNEVKADANGNPITDPRLFLLACNLPENDVRARYPSLWEYLQIGVQRGVDKRYLCGRRSPWYAQEKRPASPLLCTYMGRQGPGNKKPFRFILNHSQATAPNVYLMLYPKPNLEKELKGDPNLLKAVWQTLNEISPDVLVSGGRVYGGGLHKIEPGELANVSADGILAIFPGLSSTVRTQLSFFDGIV